MQYLENGFYPVQAPAQLMIVWKGKLLPSLWSEVADRHKVESPRNLAREYGVSHEAVRRVLVAAKST